MYPSMCGVTKDHCTKEKPVGGNNWNGLEVGNILGLGYSGMFFYYISFLISS